MGEVNTLTGTRHFLALLHDFLLHSWSNGGGDGGQAPTHGFIEGIFVEK